MSYYGLNRTVCEVLEEMRKLDKTKNYSSLLALIEEAQSMVNRMEAKLYSIKDLERMDDKIRELKKEIKTLDKKKKQLEDI